VVNAVSVWFAELQAAGRSAATVRPYGMDLLRWSRFLWAADVAWDPATRTEARDLSRWLQVAGRPVSAHWRHQDDVEPQRNERVGFYRPKVATRIPRAVPDAGLNEIFARLPSHRDRALLAFYLSTGARASELLSVTAAGVDPGRQLISVVRKGSGATQQLRPCSDAFVWLRLYQLEMGGMIPPGRRQPLWWARRGSPRPLTYHAVHRMFERVNAPGGHHRHAPRHTAAYRMAEDPALPISDVQLMLATLSSPRPRST